MTMLEEINRLVTDSISDWFFCTEPAGVENLIKEDKSKESIFHVGQVMIDDLLYQCDKLQAADKTGFESEVIKDRLGRYGVVTLHRPSNVDDAATFADIAQALTAISERLPLVFLVHPRTLLNRKQFGLDLGDKARHHSRPLTR